MKIKNVEYKIVKLNTFQQFNVARRLAPVLTFLALQKDRDQLKKGFSTAFCGLTQSTEQHDMDTILAACLSTVKRRDGEGYVNVYVNGMLAYDDIDLNVMLELIWEVLCENNLISFFSVDPSSLTGQPGGQPVSSGSGSQTERVG